MDPILGAAFIAACFVSSNLLSFYAGTLLGKLYGKAYVLASSQLKREPTDGEIIAKMKELDHEQAANS